MANNNYNNYNSTTEVNNGTVTSSNINTYSKRDVNDSYALNQYSNSLRKDLGIEQQGHTNFNSFNIYKNLESQDFLSSGIAYVFFTKPCLHFGDDIDSTLVNNINTYSKVSKSTFFNPCPFIDDIVNRKNVTYKDVLRNLKGGNSGFVHFITNLVQSFETQDITTETFNANETFRGYKLTMPGYNAESHVGGSFSLSFNETRNMEVTVFHKIWSDYIDAIRRGVILPASKSVRSYTKDRIQGRGYIDYMNSVYYFLLAEDGKTIKYYAKYTGVFPTNVPYSSFNHELGTNNLKKVTINYQYNFKEDMNPEILKEFNYVAGQPQMKDNMIQLHGITSTDLATYTQNQTIENGWKKGVKVAMHKLENGEVNDYLLFD